MTTSGRRESASALEEQLQVSIEYTVELPPFGPALLRELSSLCDAVFSEPVKDLRWRLENMPCQTVVCARAPGRVVGFKAGYAMSESRYYSWLGGVHPDWQRRGIASRLMELQHDLIGKRGFEYIETATDESNAAMTRANLKHGFAICGLRSRPKRVQVLFSRRLP
jgi:ribosomal protein S18 acetylase RimI-like enzyme